MTPHFRRFAFFLSIATLVQSCALLQISKTHSSIGTFLFMELKINETTSTYIDFGGALIVVILSAILVVLTQLDRKKLLVWIAIPIVIWMCMFALSTFMNGGSFGSRFALFAYSARMGLPLAVLGFYLNTSGVELFLKFVIAITFITHGIEAWTGHPGFIDYVFTGMNTIFGVTLSETQSTNLLRAVGIMDILCGLALLGTRSKKLVLWMAFWGLMTATLRIFGFGSQNWGELAIRVSHFALPIALYYYWRHLVVKKLSLSNDFSSS